MCASWAAEDFRVGAADEPVAVLSVETGDAMTGVATTASGVLIRNRAPTAVVEFSVVAGRALFEGDIDLGPVEYVAAEDDARTVGEVLQAAVTSNVDKRWKDGRVPVEVPPVGSAIRPLVAGAIQQINHGTNASFVPRTAEDQDYLTFELAAYCSSQVGRAGGGQVVQVSPTAAVGNLVHEFCHALGLWHEQSREDRDQFVRVVWSNILPGFEHNFRQRVTDGDDVGPYDYGSIMHYPRDAFSVNGSDTLQSLQPGAEFGQRRSLSAGDIAAINDLYPAARTPATTRTADQFSVEVPAQSQITVSTAGWHPRRRVHWDVIPTSGPRGSQLVDWTLGLGLDAQGVTYYFTITNLVSAPVTVEARYVVLEDPT